MERRIYKDFSNAELNHLLEDIPQKKWPDHEELLKEGLQRYLQAFMKIKVK